jgi:hypothetical protein
MRKERMRYVFTLISFSCPSFLYFCSILYFVLISLLSGLRFFTVHLTTRPVTVASRFETWTIFTRSNTRVVGSNPTRGVDVCVCLFCVCFVLCIGKGLATGSSPVRGDLPTVYKKNLNSRGCRVVRATIPPQSLNSVFYTGPAISFKYLLNYHHEAEWTPFQTYYFSEKNLVAPGIEPRPLDL